MDWALRLPRKSCSQLSVGMLVLLLVGCGGGTAASPTNPSNHSASPDAAPSGHYLPLTVGTVWTYQITSASGATGQGTETVEAAENAPGGGQPALRIHSIVLDGGTIGWEQTSGSSTVQYEEQQLSQPGAQIDDKQYMPSMLVLDESTAHLTAGATWTEHYAEVKTTSKNKLKTTSETVVWTIEAVGESVTVPAGTFSCIRVSRNHTSSTHPSMTIKWYAPGVGKVQENGAGQNNDQTLQLASVSTP